VIPDPDGHRAQLVLVGGLVIAVGLVALAIVLNSGIYTHNLASRADPIASEAVGHAAVVDDSVEGLVEFAVRHHPDDFTAQEANVTTGVSNVSELVARESARRGVLTNATVAATYPGTTVNQTGDREFTDQSGTDDWEVATDAHGVRDFGMEVEHSSLESGSDFEDVFNVTFRSPSADVVVSVYDGGGWTAVLVTNTTSGRSFGPCTDGSLRTGIDLTGATVAGEHCAALEQLGDLSRPFDLRFDDAGNVTGSYSLVANTTTVGNAATTTGPGPGQFETLYSVRVEVRFQSHRVDYRTDVTAAPGEPDG
jgi:hypothetical protein